MEDISEIAIPLIRRAYSEILSEDAMSFPAPISSITVSELDRCRAYVPRGLNDHHNSMSAEHRFCESIKSPTNNNNRLLLVMARAGGGKSTFIRYCLSFLASHQIPYTVKADTLSIDWQSVYAKNGLLTIWPTWAECLIYYATFATTSPATSAKDDMFRQYISQHKNTTHSDKLDGSPEAMFMERIVTALSLPSARRVFLIVDNTDRMVNSELADAINSLIQLRNKILQLDEKNNWRNRLSIIVALRNESWTKINRFVQSPDITCEIFNLGPIDPKRLIESRNKLAGDIAIFDEMHYQFDRTSQTALEMHTATVRGKPYTEFLSPTEVAVAIGIATTVEFDDDQPSSTTGAGSVSDGKTLTAKSSEVLPTTQELMDKIAGDSGRRRLQIWREGILGRAVRQRRKMHEANKKREPFKVTRYPFICSILCLESDCYSEASPLINLYDTIIGADLSNYKKEPAPLLIGGYALLNLYEAAYNVRFAKAQLRSVGFQEGLIDSVFENFYDRMLIHKQHSSNWEDAIPDRGLIHAHYSIVTETAYTDTMALTLGTRLGIKLPTHAPSATRVENFSERFRIGVDLLCVLASADQAMFQKDRSKARLAKIVISGYQLGITKASHFPGIRNSLASVEGKEVLTRFEELHKTITSWSASEQN